MSKQLHFLGWDKPVTDTVARYILNDVPAPLVQMDGTLIVVPTKEAGRRLREKMMIICRENKSALLDARIVTPLFFIQSRENIGFEAGATLVRSVWIKTLLSLRKDDCPALFPRGIPENNHQWAFAMSKIIQQLREDLSDGCLSINSVLEKHEAELQELQRWSDLGKIETMYLENLRKTGRSDPCELKLTHAKSPTLPAGIKKIIMASVPDPSLLALETIKALSRKLAVEIMVMAPKELQYHFDDWGRPFPDKWITRLIDIPEPEKTILIAGDPACQAQSVADLIHDNEYHFNDICIGVPDRAVIPYLQNKLESAGITAFDPDDRPLKDHHLYHLIKAWRLLTENASFKNIAAFLRKADILKHLQATCKISAVELLTEIDQLQNKALPQTMQDAVLALTKTGENKFPNLKTAIKFTQEILSAANSDASHAALRGLLEQVFALKMITGDSDDDKDFKAVASNISEILNDITYSRVFTKNFPVQLINQLIVSRLDELSIPRHREGAMIDLNGWLELAWNDAPFMIITGFNEGQVPDSQKCDVFLPDSLKKTLGLRNNESRFARDAYLLSLIIAMREQTGRVVLITGKTSPEGDPLKPSRLLFRCPDKQLAKRAESIFKEVEEKTQHPPYSVTFKLNPAAPLSARNAIRRGEIAGGSNRRKQLLPAELHATQFRDYLACPFRFFLKHILKMECTGEKTELDALDFGTAIHAILERFSGNPKINGSTDPNVIQKYLTGMLADYFQKTFGNNHSFPILYAQAIAKQRLQAFAEHQAQSSSEGWEIVERELPCQLTISGMKVAGKIDRVDKKRNERRMRIIDYKTSDSAENPVKQHIRESRREIPDYARLHNAENKRWNDLQLPLYRLMFKNMPLGKECKEVELCYFNLPKAISNSGLAVWENFTQELEESAYKSAEIIIGRIKQGIFWPPADSVKYDDFEPLFEEDMRDFFDGDMLEAFMKEHWRK